MKTVTKSRGRM